MFSDPALGFKQSFHLASLIVNPGVYLLERYWASVKRKPKGRYGKEIVWEESFACQTASVWPLYSVTLLIQMQKGSKEPCLPCNMLMSDWCCFVVVVVFSRLWDHSIWHLQWLRRRRLRPSARLQKYVNTHSLRVSNMTIYTVSIQSPPLMHPVSNNKNHCNNVSISHYFQIIWT